jgi:hypothetical protein
MSRKAARRRNVSGRKENRTLAPNAQGGPAAHKEATRRAREALRIAERRKKAWDLFVGRDMTFEQIGKALDVSGKTAHGDVIAYRDAAVREEMFGDPDLARQRQQAGLSALVATHWKGRRKRVSAEVILGAFQQEARLLGLNLQRKDTFTAEQVVGLVRGLTALFMEVVQDPDLRRQFSQGLKRRVGGALPGAVVSEQQDKKGG